MSLSQYESRPNRNKKAQIVAAGDRPIVIFGLTDIAQLLYFYLTEDAGGTVAAFTVDRKYLQFERLFGLPVVPFEEVTKRFPSQDYDLFVACGHHGKNRLRADKIKAARRLGYRLASYVSSRAKVSPDASIGDNIIIMEKVRISAHVKICDGVIVGSGSHISRHVILSPNCYVAPNCILGPKTRVPTRAYVGRPLRSLSKLRPFGGKRSAPRPLGITRANRSGTLSFEATLAEDYAVLANAEGARDDFRRFLGRLRLTISKLPLSLAVSYYQTLWNLPRAHLLQRSPLAYSGLFADLKDMKRRLASRIARELKAPQRKSISSSKPRKVLFVLPYVARNDTTVVNVAKKFKLMSAFWPDAQFFVLVTDDFFVSPQDLLESYHLKWGNQETVLSAAPPNSVHSASQKSYIEKVFKTEKLKVEVAFTSPQKSYSSRMEDALQIVEEIKPEVILCFSLESILDSVLFNHYPVVRFGLGEFIPVFSADADLFVTPHDVRDLAPILRDNRLAGDLVRYRSMHFPVKVVGPQQTPTRGAFQLSKGVFYVVSISRHFDTGIFEDISKIIRRFLDGHPNARWILIGLDKAAERPKLLRHKRIQVLYDCPDVIGFSHVADVVVPVTHGTGMTVLSAMSAGTPVLTVQSRRSPYTASEHKLPSDAAILVGPENVSEDAGTLGQKLERLYSDKRYYNSCKVAMKLRAKQLMKERSALAGDQFQCIEEGIKRGRTRLTKKQKAGN